MEKSGKVTIKIEFEDIDGQVVSKEKVIELSKEELNSLDCSERIMLDGSYEVMRSALSSHISRLSEKKTKPGK